MIPAAARAADRFFHGALASAAGAFRAVALLALAVCIGWAVLRAARAFDERRRAPRPRTHRRRLLAAAGAAQVVLAATALLGAGTFRIADPRVAPIAAMSACIGFLFLGSALLLAGLAASPARRDTALRILAATLAAVALAPALVLLFFSRSADPPKPVVIGSLWRTPTALYVSGGGRARRESGGSAALEADIVDAQSRVFGVSRQDLAGFRSPAGAVPWRGAGGFGARLAARWPAALSGPLFSVTRRTLPIALPENERLWILRGGGGISFAGAAAADAPDARLDPD
jgi:hypothetical protein